MVLIAQCAPWLSSFPPFTPSATEPTRHYSDHRNTGTHQPSQKPHLLVEKHGQHELIGLLRQVGEEQDVIGWILGELLGEMAASEQGYPRKNACYCTLLTTLFRVFLTCSPMHTLLFLSP